MGILNWLKRRRPVELDEDDFKEEIRAHLAIAAQEKVADGADEHDARYAALKEFGNVTLTTEAARSVWTPRWLEALRDLTSDVRYAIRALAKNPAFSLTVIGVLMLGIGLNAAVFTMLKSMALAPLAGVDEFQPARRRVPRDDGAASAPPVVPGLPVPARSRSGVLGSLRLRRRAGRPGSETSTRARCGVRSSPATTSRSSAFARRSAGRCCRRTRSLRAVIP